MTQPPRVGNPPHLDVEQAISDMYVTLEQLARVVESGEHRVVDPGLEEETAELERKVKPLQRVWTVLGLVAGILVTGAAAGVAYNQFMVDNVDREDLDAFKSEEVDPIEDDVVQLKLDVAEVTSAVDNLVEHDKERQEIEYKQALLDEYRSDYQECLSEYAAAKNSGRLAERCKKDPRHIELEVDVRSALGR